MTPTLIPTVAKAYLSRNVISPPPPRLLLKPAALVRGVTAPSVDSIRSGRPCLGDRTEAVGSDLERDVEEIVVILDCVHPRDLGDLLLAEVPPELLERCVRDSPVLGGLLRIRERRSLPRGDERARPLLG